MSGQEGVSIQIDLCRCVSLVCCFFFFVSTCVFAGVFGWAYSEWSSGVPFDPDKACRLTYTNDSLISEDEMRVWAGKEGWPLSHPVFDQTKTACTCRDASLRPTWIAPGDLVSLYKEELSSDFVSKYEAAFSPQDHVKVCLDSPKLLQLWETGHCHSKDKEGKVDEIFRGWDGSLYCLSWSDGGAFLIG